MSEYDDPTKKRAGFYRTREGTWRSNDDKYLVCDHPVNKGCYLVYRTGALGEKGDQLWYAFTWEEVLRAISLDRQQGQLAILCDRIFEAVEKARLEKDLQRELILRRILSDLQLAMAGNSISHLGKL